MTFAIRAALVVLFAAAFSPSAHAQGPVRAASSPGAGPEGRTGGRAAGSEQIRREIIDQIRTMRVWRMTQALKLTEAQVAKLFPILARFDDRERDLAQERAGIAKTLRQAADAPIPASAAEINRLIDQLLKNRSQKHALEDERIKDLRQILSPAQQAKLVLLMPRLEELMRNWLREAQGRRDGVGDAAGDGPGDGAADEPDRGERRGRWQQRW